MKKGIGILVILFVSLNFVFADDLIKIGEIQNGNLVLTINETTLKNVYNAAARSGQIAKSVELLSGVINYVVINGNNTEGSRNFAIELIVKEKNLFLAKGGSNNAVIHYCSGFCCSDCKFIIDTATKKMAGCQCNQSSCSSGARCDHSMSTGFDGIFADFELSSFYKLLSSGK